MMEKLGLTTLMERILSGWTWTKYDLKPFADLARQYKQQIKTVLHFTVNDRVSDTQIIHQLLNQFGLRFEQKVWSIFIPNHEGEKLRVYGLNTSHWEAMSVVLQRREDKRNAAGEVTFSKGSDPSFKESYQWGDLLNPQDNERHETNPENVSAIVPKQPIHTAQKEEIGRSPLLFPPPMHRTS
jgi:hypothetical protein